MLKKFGEKITKKKLLIASGIALVAIVIAIVAILSKGEGIKKKTVALDSELARAMTYGQFSDEDANVDGTDYVKFNAFFLRDINNDGNAEKIKGTCKQIGKEDTLYMELNVLTNGYLENGVITINSDNFYLQTAIPKDNEVKDNVISNNAKQISLNQIKNGTQKLLTGIVRSGDYSRNSLKDAAIGDNTTKYSKVNSITLTGTHVAEDGTKTEISKTVNLNVDWYGTVKTEIPNYIAGVRNLHQSHDNTDVIDDENDQAVFSFDIGMQETNNELLLSKVHLEGTIPQLNGYDPLKVEVTNSNVELIYEESTKKFQVERLTELNDDGTIKMQCYDDIYNEKRYNKFNLKVTYPLEAYNSTEADTVEMKIPVSGYYEAYNNPNDEFDNPYKSNVANEIMLITFSKPSGEIAIFDVRVGNYIADPAWRYIVSKKKPLKIYNKQSLEENNDTYKVLWSAYTGTQGNTSGIVMKETKNGDSQVSDKFIKADSSEESMENVTSYTGIYFKNESVILNEDGWIRVYNDETNELLHEFTKSDWSVYSEILPFKYLVPVKHIRIETSQTNDNSSLHVYNIKKIDDKYITENYTKEQFDDLKYIKSILTGYIGGNYINTDTHSARYEAPYSIAEINVSESAISTQKTEKNMQLKISAVGYENKNQLDWKNGAFLIKIPNDIIDIVINSVEINNYSVNITSYEIYKENGEKFIKINTSNEELADFTITIDCDITPDPRIATTTENFELYASNENGVEYFNPVEDTYDVNGNLNTLEMVNKSTISISFISPSSLLTNQYISDYDDSESTAVAPEIADLSKDRRTATVNIDINNNYANTISEVKILGRVPFEGNKYSINGEDMGSDFTATMNEQGIKVPDNLKEFAKIYYSENGDATKDLQNENNGWTKTPSDYSKIKSYLIDFENYTFSKGEQSTISYNLSIPEGVEYNKVSYSHHAVYFSLDTTEGKYKTQTEPNKVGIRIAQKYDLELTKFQAGIDKVISGATYAIQEEGEEKSKARITGIDGKLTIPGLYVDKTYVIKEIKSPDDYELNNDLLKFTTSENDGKLVVTKQAGNVKNIQAVQASDNSGYKVEIQVEDEVKAKLKLTKVEKDTEIGISQVTYELKGNGKRSFIYTDKNGEALVNGICVGEEYTLEEKSAKGYYVEAKPIKLVVNNNQETYSVTITDGSVKNAEITMENEFPTVNLKVEDTKIPQYQLQITKKASNRDVVLAGTYFQIKGETIDETIVTDANGEITLKGLYAYEENEYGVTGEYTLQELAVPNGYVVNNNPIRFRVDKTDDGFKTTILEGEVKQNSIDGNIIKFEITNDPIFQIVKKDGESAELLPNVKFAISKCSSNEQGAEVYSDALDTSGNIVGEKETINGKEYQIITTDENGEINLDLVSGIYKVVEVETLNQYILEDEASRTYYIVVGDNENDLGYGNLQKIANVNYHSNGSGTIVQDIAQYKNGYVLIKKIESETIIEGTETEDKNAIKISKSGYYLIQYSSKDKIVNVLNLPINNDYEVCGFGAVNDKIIIYANLERNRIFSATLMSNGIEYITDEDENYQIIINSDFKVEKVSKAGYDNSDDNHRTGIKMTDFKETSDGGFVVGVMWTSIYKDDKDRQYFINADATYNNTQLDFDLGKQPNKPALIVEYNSDFKVEKAVAMTNQENEIRMGPAKIKLTSDGGYIVVGTYRDSSLEISAQDTVSQEEIALPALGQYGASNPFIMKLNSDLKVEWLKTPVQEANNTNYLLFSDVVIDKNGDYIVVGKLTDQTAILIPGSETSSGESINIEADKNAYGSDRGIIIKYTKEGKIEWVRMPKVTIPREQNANRYLAENYCEIEPIEDNGYIIIAKAGASFYDNTTINAEFVKDNKPLIVDTSTSQTFLIKIDENGMIENIKNLVFQNKNESLSLSSYGGSTKAFIKDSKLYFSYGMGGGIISKYQLKLSDIKEKARLEVENDRKEYKITTDVEEFNGNKGGSISGEDEVAYEIVKYGDSSIKEIKMIPDSGYEIISITINGIPQVFIPNVDGSYTLPQINDIQEDKHIVVAYSIESQKLTINKTDNTGNKKIEGAKFKFEQIFKANDTTEILAGLVKNNNNYYFTYDGEKYISNNKGVSSSQATSYVKLDLTNANSDATLSVNAEISSEENYDYGYAWATEKEKITNRYDSTGNFIKISGTVAANDYTYTLEKGKVYYLHFMYYKDGSGDSGEDTFSINSIKLQFSSEESLKYTEVETDANGKAEVQLPFGKYKLTEIEAPDGYVLDSTSREIEFTENGTHEITLQNTEIPKIVVHHYIKGTTTKLAEDETSEGTIGEKYTTAPYMDFEKYELEKDSNGEYVLPANAVGTYKTGTTEVTYYYVEKQIPLTVHHYIEGTTDKVPLKAGGTADDVTGSGKESESYTTSAISNDKLSDEYELVEVPANASGTYLGNEVIVTYYYKKVSRDVNLVKYKEDGKTPLAGAKFTIEGNEYTTDSNGKIKVKLEAGAHDITEIEAPDGYKLPTNPTTKITITRATTSEDINITNEKKTGTVTVHHYIEGTTDKVPLKAGGTAADETKTGNVGDMYATKPVDNLSERYELVAEPDNGSGTYIDGNIEVIYYYKIIPTSVIVHHYLEGTTTKLANDVTIDGIVGDNYTTGVATVDNKYELVEVPANANGKMTREQIVVIYYYRVKDTSVLVHHYKEGTSESLSADVTINGKVDDAYTTSKATDIPSKYELVEVPTNATGKMTVAQTVVTYYYRLKSTGVDVHYYKEGTTEKVSNDVAIEGKVDQSYTTTPATDVASKYELIGTPANATGTMTEDRITVIYYYRLKDTSVLVHHYLEGTTTKLADDVTINGQVDDAYKTVVATDLIAGKYELVEEPTNKSGTMTEAQIVVIYYYRVKDTSVLVHHYIKDTTTSLSADVTINGKIDDKYTTTKANDIPEQYELVGMPSNASGTMTEEQIVVTYYYQLKNYPYTVNYLEKGTDNVLHDAKQGRELIYGSTVKSSDEIISIDGYNYDSVDKETLTIGTTNNVINIYYTKRNDLSYKVNYLEKGTNKVLHEQKVQDGMTFDAEVTSSDEVIAIDGYNYDSVDKTSIKITTGENVINIYYTKRTDLAYEVNYLEKDTNKVLHVQKNKTGMTFGTVITSNDEIIDIDGYNYDSVDKDTLTIGTGENVINIYYTKRNDLSYKVNYLEKGTNKVLHAQKMQDGMTFKDTITSSDEVIAIDGYNYDSVDKESLTITTGENVINIYYTKRTDLSYKVNYLEKDTNKVLHAQKTQEGMTFESTVTSANEVIEIDGYNYDSVDKESLMITTGENVINIYYTKRNDLSYKVNYLEKDTNKVLHAQKMQDGMTFESTVNSSDEVIAIDGYNYDSVDKESLTITTGENVINIYYTKRTDLSYTVNYLEKDTNIVLHEPKTTGNMTFESTVTSSKEIIEIDGYNYDSVDKDILTITTGTNEINIYYTKRNDLSYTVNYLEKGTNKTIYAPKVTQNMTFGTEITSSKEIIVINGYSYDSVDKESLTITTGENVINIYYTKVSGLSYTVNYLEKDTEEVLHAPKTTGDMTFEDEITSNDEVIEIDGYNYDSVDKDKLVIGTGENVINIYYTKRNDLSYKVNYLEKDTNKVLHDQKVQDGMTFEDVVISTDEVISIDGYNYDSVDKESLTITTSENVINIYYTKRTDLSYKVNYLEKDTNKILHEQKIQDGMTFESVVTSVDEVINIYGYNYDSVDKDTLTITTVENVINIYYTKKDTKVTVHYYEEGTTNKVSEDVEIPGKVFDNYETESATDIPSKYELIAEPENKNGTMTEDEITVIYYYRKKATQVIVHYYEENTTNKLSEDVTINGRVDDEYTTISAKDIPIKYELVAEPVNKTGSMTEETIEVIYYYRVKDAVVNVRYLEKGTNKVLADQDRLDGKVDDLYETTPKTIDGYQLVEHTGNEKGKFEVEPLTITYYYLYKTKATVQYIDKITGQILEQSTTEGLEGDDFVTESKDFENYVLVEEPTEKTVKMTKEEQVLKYYYIHVSGGVIEKHIDVISGQILANESYEGNEGDAYDIPSRTFEGYDLVEDRLPTNSKGTMKVEPVEVIYYYIYRTKVTAEYIDKNTGNKLTEDEVQNGHDGDNYTTERKTFDDYKLVEVPANADGSMTKEDIKVTYYYVHTSGGVIVNHIDVKTNKQLLDETKEEGYEGDPYETHEENISGYDLVKEKYPENATGKMTIEPTRVIYYYIKKTEVNVKYVDKETGEEIDVPSNIPGHEGDDYTTEPKELPGYDLVEEPENKNGTMTADPIDVIYYYRRPAKVIVNYYDEDTKEKLADEVEITGHQNDEYTTEQKDIKYYEISKVPENKDGKMTVTVTKDENGKEIVEDTTYVNYYYRKLIFNLRVDKTIASVIVNGQETAINGNLGKVEVHRKDISTANVKVVYKIKVTNDSELTGRANVVENIPSGMTMIAENNPGWTINQTTASIETDEIKPGESREYQVVLGWQNGDSNVGTKENVASIITENEAGFDEKSTSDNESKADLIVAVGTGEIPYVAIAGGILMIMISMTAGVYVINKKRK